MLTRLSLRLRVFLFFALLAIGSVAIVVGSLGFAASRADPGDPASALVLGASMAAFLVAGLVLSIWWLFDENVAKPIGRISADLRARAHAEVNRDLDAHTARYLGDLAPAAEAVSKNLASVRGEREQAVAQQTERLRAQTDQLRALLSDLQAGLLLCSPGHKLVFYNPAATTLLRETGRPRLDRSVFDLLREGPIRRTYTWLTTEGAEGQSAELLISTTGCGRTLSAHMRLVSGALGIGDVPGYVLTLRDVSADLRLHTERERLLTETVQSLRAPAAALRAQLDIAEASAAGATGSGPWDEAETLVGAIEEIATRHDAQRDAWWPMQDVRASHLFDALRGQLGPSGPPIDAPSPHMWLRCDGFALVNLIAGLVEAAVERGLAQAFALHVVPDGGGALIRLQWTGPAMPMTDLAEILAAPIKDSPLAVTGREVLDYHNSDVWPETGPDGISGLVLPIAEAAASGTALRPAGSVAERPTVFDFDLLNQVRDGSKTGKSLRDLTYVVFDTETTGLDPKGGDEIVQVAAVRLVNGKRVPGEEIDMLVDPERPIPPSATKVHGVSEDMVRGAPTIDVAGARFHRFCEGAVLVAHNAPFDMAFFHRHAERIGGRFDHPVFDTVLLSAILFGEQETHTLDALADRFGVVIPEAARHTAMGDTIATAEVFRMMLPMLAARGLDTFDATLDAMTKNSKLLREMKARVG